MTPPDMTGQTRGGFTVLSAAPTPEIEKLRAELDAVRAERDALLSAARAVVDTGFFIPAIVWLREAVEKARKAP